jgi:hypothetical protein
MKRRRNESKREKRKNEWRKKRTMDNIIKNPKRSVPKSQKPYEPEYVKRNTDLIDGITHKIIPAKKSLPSSKQEEIFMDIDGTEYDDNEAPIPYKNGHIIDNNDFVNFGYENEPIQEQASEDLNPNVGEYILMVFGKLISCGNLSKIENEIKSIMYGENSLFSGKEIEIDDIVVLKRMNIKVGIFVDG